MKNKDFLAGKSRKEKNQANISLKPKKRKTIGIKVLAGVLIGALSFYIFSVLPPGGLSQKAVIFDISSAENAQNAAPQATEAAAAEPNVNRLPEGASINSQDPYTFIWMSDTQGLAEYHPEIYTATTQWVADSRKELNIQYLIHTGDFVNKNSDPEQWKNAKKAMSLLNGNVPYLTVAGNHDILDSSGNYKDYSNYFSMIKEAGFEALPMFGDFYKNGQGRYDLININSDSYIILSMGYGVDRDAVDWMNTILRQYIDRTAILCVHGYMDENGKLTSDGKILYPEVVVPNPNVKIVLCGHRHGVNHFVANVDSDGDGKTDRNVYELLSNYQDEKDAGNGYLSILTFDDRKREIRITSYSPYLQDYIHFGDKPELEEFTIPMEY